MFAKIASLANLELFDMSSIYLSHRDSPSDTWLILHVSLLSYSDASQVRLTTFRGLIRFEELATKGPSCTGED